jgi:hypothetical protein
MSAGQAAIVDGTKQGNQPAQQTPTPTYGPWMMRPGIKGPEMMYNWTPEQRRQHWEQMRQKGYGPGMLGYGPGWMMGPTTGTPPKTSAQ